MSVYVIIKRKLRMNQPDKLLPLMNELNRQAKKQPGYLSTVTLQSTEDPEDYMVMSQWETADAWNHWFVSKERRDVQSKVESLIGERTFYEIFQPVTSIEG